MTRHLYLRFPIPYAALPAKTIDGIMLICVDEPQQCSITFTLEHLPEHPIGYDVEMQYCTNLHDPNATQISYHWMPEITKDSSFSHECVDIKQIYYKWLGGVRFIRYRAHGIVYPPQHTCYGNYYITFRGRYKPKFTDTWSDWSYLTDVDGMDYTPDNDFGTKLSIIYFKPVNPRPTIPTNIYHICINCILNSCNNNIDNIPDFIVDRARKLDFVCNICHKTKQRRFGSITTLYYQSLS